MLLWIIAAFIAYFVKGLTGFANTLVFTSILAYGANNAAITPVDLVIGIPANAAMAWRFRKEANWRIWLPAALMMFVGIIPGALFLKNMDAHLLKLAFGALVALLGAEMLLRELRNKKSKGSRAAMVVIGVVAGIFSGMYGVGALMAAYLSRTSPDTRAFKGSLNLVFLLENLFRGMIYIVTGVFTWEILRRALLLIPVMGIGLFAGMKSANLVSERIAKRLVMVMLILSGIALVLNNL